jgi:sigma-B regulation protein RsbU (phosphoserine phosphatase)
MTDNPLKDKNNQEITVLLIDDQPIVAAQVKKWLAPEKDIRVEYCANPLQALTVAEEVKPSVILQDLQMPDIDGFTLIKFFKAKPGLQDIPLVVLSGNYDATAKADAFKLGANDYLVKLWYRDDMPEEEKKYALKVEELSARIRYHSNAYNILQQRNKAYEDLYKSQQELAQELAKAAEFVISLIPPKIAVGNITTDWKFTPSAQLGGDSFGYHWIDDDHFAIYLLDVCGHGVGSALLSVSAFNAIRTQSLPVNDFSFPEDVLNALNAAFQMSDHNDMYFTLWYGVYNKNTSELKYISAGHPPALLLDASGNKSELINQNFIVGGLPSFPFSSSSVKIVPPSVLYVFSDGAYEIMLNDGSMWTLEEMENFLQKHCKDDASEINELFEFVKVIGGKDILDDDFSILKISFK